MSRANRNDPKRAESSDATYSMMEFMREFPDDVACLDWLWRERYAADGHTAYCEKCEQSRKHHRVKDRPAYDCDACGNHIHPLAGTIFHKSATSLQLWFYAMYLMSQTRCGVSAKHLERELGVTYKTAWRMANLIRNQLMDDQDDQDMLSGEVEADETWIGGKPRAGEIKSRTQRGKFMYERKTPVFAAVERGGRVRARVVTDNRADTLGGMVREFVVPEARLITDDWRGYETVGKEYAAHDRINHSKNIYVSGTVHTNTIEGFFANLKNGIRGNYHAVSPKWLQGYLNEYAWRYNHREQAKRAMFKSLLLRAVV